MSDPFVAEIRIFPFNFAPKGWALCNGQLLPISQNTALFSLLGTTYGGDGKSNFALPDLQGSTPMQQGQGPGLSLRVPGRTGRRAGSYPAADGNACPYLTRVQAAGATGRSGSAPVSNLWAGPKRFRQLLYLLCSSHQRGDESFIYLDYRRQPAAQQHDAVPHP